MTLDWVSITASIVALLSLVASVFSAIGAARSADVARTAEQRIVSGERNLALRELMRTAAKITLETRLVTQALENASRSAIANANFYGNAERKMPLLIENGKFQDKVTQINEQANHGITMETVQDKSDEWIAKKQLELDKNLIELSGEKAWAVMREEQLRYANRQIAEDITMKERANNIYVRQGHDGKII